MNASTDQRPNDPSASWTLDQLVDLERYPIDRPGTPGYAKAVADAQVGLAAQGASELEGFLTPQGLAAVVDDAIALEKEAWRAAGPATAYLEFPDPELPLGHPRRWLGMAGVNAVAYDLFPSASPLRWIYESDEVLRFLDDTLGRDALHRYADPLGGLNVASMGDGDELQWHFDQTDFVVSLAIRDADEGGDFEVAPLIRSPDDEKYEDVAKVLDGDHADVVTLPMRPGTLLVFEGRYSLHRVSPIAGDVTRLVALFGYDTQPGTMSSDLLKSIRYGRTEPIVPVP